MIGCVVWFVVLSRVVCRDAATLELKWRNVEKCVMSMCDSLNMDPYNYLYHPSTHPIVRVIASQNGCIFIP
jgi:hypothetical protein